MRIENSFIPVRGVGEATERSLWERGITHWDDFDPDAVGSTTGERVEAFIQRGRERLADGDARFFHDAFPSSHRWRLYENFRSEACFFDIETTGLSQYSDDVTTVSLHRDGETRTYVNDPDPPVGDPLTVEALREELRDAPLLVTFNGKRFDVPFLEEAFDLSLDAPHIDLMYPCKQLGLTGGLKAVERELGVERDRPDVDGREAVRLWRRYERGAADALETLVSYNRDDAANLRLLMDDVAAALHEETFV
ncbi:exonuclease [Halobacteriales archaeon QS_5_70_17]|nr:MAG: exonuclease [Halobacteriales archaeon QS_5_70_17]